MTIHFYDVSLDEMRDATQDDFDKLMRVAQAYGKLKSFLHDQIGRIEGAEQDAHKFIMAQEEPERPILDLDARETLQ